MWEAVAMATVVDVTWGVVSMAFVAVVGCVWGGVAMAAGVDAVE